MDNHPIRSMFDDDLYKFAMQNVVLDHYPDAVAEYRFTNRRPQGDLFPSEMVDVISRRVSYMVDLAATDVEMAWIGKNMPWFSPSYLSYLKNYRFNPDEVNINFLSPGTMDIRIIGPWHSAIRWEVPLMAIISETFFEFHNDWGYSGQAERALVKAEKLNSFGYSYADFGTRRRRSYNSQDIVVKTMSDDATGWDCCAPYQRSLKSPGHFVGTSNVHLAMKHDTKPIGTMAHEMFMALSALEGLRHANRFTLQKWNQTYNGRLGIALTDTFGTESFFKDFDGVLGRLFDGLRHDSGCPFDFGTRVIEHYEKLGIDPRQKTIVFSDSLDVDLVGRLTEAFAGRIGLSFGIGTHFTNDYPEARKALNMVIKMYSINNIPVVKLSDDPGKATGDNDAVRIARNVHFGTPLDE